MTGFDEATMVQIGASQPTSSTWLSANAGSGKTKVLTDRVTRLLLEKVDPQHILCLTYTKAAASEMQNRLFKRLGTWAMLPDDKLKQELGKLGDATGLTNERLSEARRLFASAIETPGGLKIQTIHSFCSALLRRFPLEAGVTPNFTEMDDRAAQLLRAEIIEQMASGKDAPVIHAIARYLTDEDFSKLTEEVVRHRAAFLAELPEGDLASLFKIPMGADEASIEAQVFLGGEADLIASLLPKLEASGPHDTKAAKKLKTIKNFDLSALPTLESLFLFGSGPRAQLAKIDSFPTKGIRNDMGADLDALNGFMERVQDARATRLSLAALRKTAALYDFARAFFPLYETAKQARGWLDFDDLILRTRDLLTVRDVADWVLYKIDGGIDHILVDEAQDTSPPQWEVIEALAREMSSGQGARNNAARTLFVVGDKKQSIYSFQGADAGAFDRMKALFEAQLSGTASGLRDIGMEYSFRSAQLILSLVDKVFESEAESGFTPDQAHKAFHTDKPGRVDIWPFVEKPE
ncbi:MAG: UvrD-helicase domain-containing protein, partial [Kangiellaceae bacterium]|nr:UvrD-helicase domain-containing protein [Kangiellaceae bacterium]